VSQTLQSLWSAINDVLKLEAHIKAEIASGTAIQVCGA